MEATTNFFGETLLTPVTLANYARTADCWNDLLGFHKELVSDEYVEYVDRFYRGGREQYGDSWDYLDLVTVLHAASKLNRPKLYLEIGVRRGRTVSAVARGNPHVTIIACDMWQENYAGMENPGPEFVQEQLKRNGHQGEVHFLNGDSHLLIPELLREHPDLKFDLITVDGDHTEDGALADLNTVFPHLGEGGVLVFDDISHPQHSYLLEVWRAATRDDKGLKCFEYDSIGYGVAFAIRSSPV